MLTKPFTLENVPRVSILTDTFKKIFFNVYFFLRERETERDRERAGEGQREREIQNPKQAPGS